MPGQWRTRLKAGLRFWCALALFVAAGCGPEPAEDTSKPPPPKAPTAREIRAQFDSALQPVYAIVDTCGADTRVPDEVAAQVQAQLEESKKKYQTQAAYQEGLRGAVNALEDKLRSARDKQNGVLALYLCSVIRSLDPENSRVVRFEAWGTTVKNRPVVTIRGWYEPRDAPSRTIYAFLDVYTPEDGQTHHIEVREGEEFLGLKYVKMIGNRQGILFEYLSTKDRFEVYSQSWIRRQ